MTLNSNGGDDDGARNGSGSGGETPTSSSANTLYKGWILTYQTSSPGGKSENINIADSSCKWQAKFACVSKQDKITLLYDYEASNETIAANLSAICGANCSASDSVTYRLDNGVKRELFVNYWKARLSRFEPSGYLVDRTPDEANHHHYNPSLGMLNGAPFNYSGNHHLSNRDIESIDKDSVNNFQSNAHNRTNASSSGGDQPPSSSSSQSGGGGFRFAGLFFKRGSADKSEKVKHSSLKRAKSGIQLERKKPSITSTGSSGAKESSSVTMSSNASQLDYDNRHSLPSPMRPSRSHESLSSPIASAIVTATTSTRHTPFISNQLDADSSPTGETPTTTTTTPLLSSRAIHAYYSTPYYYNSGNSNGGSSQQRMPPNNLLDQIVKIDLKRATASPVKSPASESPATSSLSSSSSSFNGCIHAIHNSLLNEENCFEMRCPSTTINIVLSNTSSSSSGVAGGSNSVMEETRQSRRDASLSSSQETSATTPTNFVRYIPTSTSGQQPRYFMCRSNDERDKWLQCVRDVAAPNQVDERHEENSLQVWLLEAKGQAISSKPNRKYFCEVYLNTELGARTCTKEKREILFWGESFEFNNIQCEFLRVEFYQQAIETTKKKSKKENVATSSHTLLGYVNIPVSSIESSQPIEKWYKLETPNSSSHSDTTSNGSGVLTNSSVDLTSQQPNSMSSLSASQTTLAVNGSGNTTTSSLTTTQSFSKDSISIRIKAKYQSVDILPIVCYSRLIEFIRSKYLKLMISLEPHLNVRTKDDLATSLIKISHKLHMQTEFLCDLVLAEVLALEDTSLTFRGNSLATKAMESYMKLVGENYLRLTLADCVRSIIDTNHDLEIDPSKVTNPSGLQANREELVQILHLVCGRVFNSCINFPLEMKHVFAKLRTECLRHGKTDEMCDTLISASIFLRFICPAILSPNLFNLTQEYPQEKAARKLTLAAKTLQTIANFSKFGGKEFYMSFDRMNRFVDEHTVLMREFLRNISTLSDEEQHELELEKTRWEKTASSTASAPISSFVLTPQHTPNSSSASVLPNNELNFDLEPIDLGKQLSILHSLLTSILSTLDEATQKKFDPELVEILREISEMKTSGFVSSLSTRSKSQQQNMTASKQQQQQQHGNKLYSYENRLHQAVMMKSHHQQHQQTSPLTTITTPIEHTMQSLAQPSSSSSSSSRYSSQMALNQQQQQVELNSSQDKLDVELQTLRNQLKDTELSLKKEQTEKYLLEYKLKQQQQENDQQMRSIINRLIKVEEELRKEQSEMHKLLKAKQELIEIQKKRIEYLTNKTTSGSTAPPKTGMSTSAATTTTNANGAGSNTPATTNNGVASLVQTHPSLSYNQHSYQPKLKAKIVQLKPQTGPNHAMITSSMSNPNINQDVQTAANMVPIIVSKLADKSSHQIAASPSSSSSSMTQFCSYLAANSLNNNTNNATQNKLHSKSSAAAQNAAQQQQQQQNGSPSSSTSSSTSSTLSSSIQHSTGGASRSQSGFLRASEL